MQAQLSWPSGRSIPWFFVITLLLGACGQGSEPEVAAPAAVRVENPQVGVVIGNLPAFFKVDVNQDDQLALVPAAAEGTGRLTISADPAETSGINLVAAVEEHKVDINGRDDGTYKGQREIGSHLGTAFYSRGHFSQDGGIKEETVIFLIHPWGDRKLRLTYVYPAGDDSRERLEEQLFEVFGEIEGLPAPGAEAG